MEYIAIFCVWALQSLTVVEGAGCNAYTGAIIRHYNFDYTSPTTIDTELDDNEHLTSDTQLEVVLNNALYRIDCSCGIITMWQFYAWRTGTVVFYVLDGNTVMGTSSFHVNDQTRFNFLEIPLSSDMWIPVRSGYTLGFYTEGEPMITYGISGGFTSVYYNTGQSEQGVGGSVRGSGTNTNNRKYAVAAYIIQAHAPMFVNAPFTTTLYTHETGTVVYTASVLDLDGTDVLTVSKTSGNSNFVYNSLTLTYNSQLSEGTYTVSLQVSDGCNAAVTETITIYLVNEGPLFTNLPASTTVDESDTATKTLYTLTATDASGDDVTCSLDSGNPPGGPFSLNRLSSGEYEIRQTSPSYDYTSLKYYDLRISCTDGVTTRYSNFQVDVIKNEPPFYNPGSGYLPASISVDRTSGASIYQLDFSDPEGDTVTASCDNCGAVPFSVSTIGEVTTTSVLGDEGYDVQISISDGTTTVGPYALSVVTSGRPYTFNAEPVFINLPATVYVMEHTAVDAFLFKVLYTDENPSDTLTLAKDGTTDANSDTYFNFNTTTGIITVKADVDFETTGAGGFEMVVTVNDGSETQHATVSGTVTFTIVNINEGITLTIGNPAITSDESSGRTTGASTFLDPSISAVDVDAGDTEYYTMDCGADSKYFYLDTATLWVHFAREYDMDAGLSGTATCNVTVRDQKGLSDTKELTLTVNNINDHSPKFPKHHYVFLISTTTTFFTELANLAATDADSDSFGSTNGVLTYSFSPASPTDLHFQIDEAGVLYVRNVSTFTGNNYVFEVIAADQGGFEGTCTVTVLFTSLATTTTTTTERTLVFTDDYKNYIWLLLCAVGIFGTLVVIALMIWKDPVVNEYISFKFFKLSEWCRKKPKPKEPKRTVGKLRVTVNKKDLENDPDNALPWELLAKDNDVPEINEVQEVIQSRIERKDRDYKDFSGLPVFERGRGARPESGRTLVHSSASRSSRQGSDSPKYATLTATNGKTVKDDNGDGGESQWGDLTERRVTLTPVIAITPNADESDKSDTEEPRKKSPVW